ncbi:hypothetical protein CYMTET_26284 [Cymbomonas tetramitiformis]|uniref:Uncharacterized protein n=1 Tax=Cymbomonas tetramitiformis TaxID=36881 RepID=A0AAE0FSE1_9CHLO|nr:hypothetical protein CYMTET_26284 [Cymbomonas tetramitiformis]
MRTISYEQLLELYRKLLNSPSAAAARDYGMFTYSTVSLSRSNEVRGVGLTDFVAPRLYGGVGPCPYWVVPCVVREAKNLKEGDITYTGSGRHSNPIACFHGAAGRYLLIRFGKGWAGAMGQVFPDPEENPEEFTNLSMWPGFANGDSICYTQMARNLKSHLADCNIEIETVERMGHWLHTALLQSYLKFFPVDGLLGAGLWPNAAQKQFDHFWDPRFFPNVSDIVQALAPWIATLKEIVRGMGAAATPSMRSIHEVCKYFVTVAIQDALELAEDTPNNPVHAMLLNNATFERVLAT